MSQPEIENTANVEYKKDVYSSNTVRNYLMKPLKLEKEADPEEEILVSGDIIKYKFKLKNENKQALINVKFSDVLDTNTQYVFGTFKVNGVSQTPTISGNTIEYIISTLLPNSTTDIEFEVEVI